MDYIWTWLLSYLTYFQTSQIKYANVQTVQKMQYVCKRSSGRQEHRQGHLKPYSISVTSLDVCRSFCVHLFLVRSIVTSLYVFCCVLFHTRFSLSGCLLFHVLFRSSLTPVLSCFPALDWLHLSSLPSLASPYLYLPRLLLLSDPPRSSCESPVCPLSVPCLSPVCPLSVPCSDLSWVNKSFRFIPLSALRSFPHLPLYPSMTDGEVSHVDLGLMRPPHQRC